MFRSPQSSTLPQCSSDLLDRGGEGDRDRERMYMSDHRKGRA